MPRWKTPTLFKNRALGPNETWIYFSNSTMEHTKSKEPINENSIKSNDSMNFKIPMIYNEKLNGKSSGSPKPSPKTDRVRRSKSGNMLASIDSPQKSISNESKATYASSRHDTASTGSLAMLSQKTVKATPNAGTTIDSEIEKTKKLLESELQKAEDNLRSAHSVISKAEKTRIHSSRNELSGHNYFILEAIDQVQAETRVERKDVENSPPMPMKSALPLIEKYEQGNLLKGKYDSQQDLKRIEDVTARLTDPNHFPASTKAKLEATKKKQEQLANSSMCLNQLGSTNALMKGSFGSISKLPTEKVPEVYNRLLDDAARKQNEKMDEQKTTYTGYPVGYKPPEERKKEQMRSKLKDQGIFATSPTQTHRSKQTDSKDNALSDSPRKSIGSNGLFDDILSAPPSKPVATPPRKVPLYF